MVLHKARLNHSNADNYYAFTRIWKQHFFHKGSNNNHDNNTGYGLFYL